MEEKNIKRRLRRFYRKIEEDEIKYTDKPLKDIKDSPKVEEEVKPIVSIDNTSQNTSNMDDHQKQRIIDKVLDDMKSEINPDIDKVSEMIYDQLSKNNVNVDCDTVKKIVANRHGHYRPNRETNNSESSGSILNNREELGLVIDDVYEELEKTDIRNKAKEEKNPSKTVEKEVKKENKKETAKKEEKKEVKKDKKKNENDILDLDFDDDSSFDDSDSDNDDDLGLKF